ncbi:hypothetical protein DFH07DRAFT_769410 [Mycena maculata]|uniref:Uncharacterized protein n=1 Tax=Mycena maculata TaxID=230809 RepID=A0AAD7JRB3_9AGAR|nr:hypothetical protein DFH07DRAFT_769410 [Mycena maculata]
MLVTFLDSDLSLEQQEVRRIRARSKARAEQTRRQNRERAHKIVVQEQLELRSFEVLETDEDKGSADGDDSSIVAGMNALGRTEDVARKKAMPCFRLLMSVWMERAEDDRPEMPEAELSKVGRTRRVHRKTRGTVQASALERRSKMEQRESRARARATHAAFVIDDGATSPAHTQAVWLNRPRITLADAVARKEGMGGNDAPRAGSRGSSSLRAGTIAGASKLEGQNSPKSVLNTA